MRCPFIRAPRAKHTQEGVARSRAFLLLFSDYTRRVMTHTSPAALAAMLALGGCATTGGATYSGVREPALVRPEHVVRAEAVPAGYERIGRVMARCQPISGYGELDGESLADVDCSQPRLERALEEAAADAGGELLVALHCRSPGGALRCEANVARPSSELLSRRPAAPLAAGAPAPAPGPGQVALLDEPRANRAWNISLAFQPQVRAFTRPARPYSGVSSVDTLPAQHIALGDATARCDKSDCAAPDLAHALRLTAARLGADSVSGVRCIEESGERSCAATLGATPYDPQSVSAAR